MAIAQGLGAAHVNADRTLGDAQFGGDLRIGQAIDPCQQEGRTDLARQALQAADANYRQVVLASFEQVADVLRALEHDAAQLDAQLRAQAAASTALDEINADYRAGVAGYLQVLSADLQYQQAVLGTLQLRAQRLQDTVALFLALGGGWRGASIEPAAARAQQSPG